MIYCKLFNLCFLYLLTSSQPEPFIFPFISPLKTLTVSECVLMNRLDPALTLAACSLAKCSQEHRTWSQARMTWGHSELSLHSLIYKISIKNVLAACISRLLREADGTMYEKCEVEGNIILGGTTIKHTRGTWGWPSVHLIVPGIPVSCPLLSQASHFPTLPFSLSSLALWCLSGSSPSFLPSLKDSQGK